MRPKIRQLIEDEKGYASSEYALGFGLMVLVVIGSISYFGEQTSNIIATASVGVSGGDLTDTQTAGGFRRPDPTDPGGGGGGGKDPGPGDGE